MISPDIALFEKMIAAYGPNEADLEDAIQDLFLEALENQDPDLQFADRLFRSVKAKRIRQAQMKQKTFESLYGYVAMYQRSSLCTSLLIALQEGVDDLSSVIPNESDLEEAFGELECLKSQWSELI